MKKQTAMFLKILFALVVVICIVMISLVFKRRSIINEQVKKNEVLLEQLKEVKNKNLQLETDVQKAKAKKALKNTQEKTLICQNKARKYTRLLMRKKGD